MERTRIPSASTTASPQQIRVSSHLWRHYLVCSNHASMSPDRQMSMSAKELFVTLQLSSAKELVVKRIEGRPYPAPEHLPRTRTLLSAKELEVIRMLLSAKELLVIRNP